MTGGYLASQIRHGAVRPIAAFREYVFRDVLPNFGNLSERADRVENEYVSDRMTQPRDDDFAGDSADVASDAHDYALGWYEMMRSLRQTMLNLLAAGYFI